jgi:ferredoxin-thioredoxin reductase catalytic subunit
MRLALEKEEKRMIVCPCVMECPLLLGLELGTCLQDGFLTIIM